MRGLRTQENSKFLSFFEIVQKMAKEKNCVFFLECGDGKIFNTETIECENLQGWLVPNDKADDFETVWKKKEEDDKWVDFFCWVEWVINGKDVDVKFLDENGMVIE